MIDGDDSISWKGVSPETSEQAREEGLVPASYICKRLKISRRTLGRAVKSGEIEVAKIIDGVKLFDPDSVDDITLQESLQNPDQKGFLIEYLLDALNTANAHIDKLVTLSHKPAQDTIAALLKENEILRQRSSEVDARILEVHDLYGKLLRETMMMELDAERERLNSKMKEDSFALVRDKLIPVMLDSMKGKKLLDSFSDVEIEAFLDSGAIEGKKADILRKELDSRRKKAAQTPKETKEPKKGDSDNGKTQSPKSVQGSRSDSGK